LLNLDRRSCRQHDEALHVRYHLPLTRSPVA
jgi:hypothetical protein